MNAFRNNSQVSAICTGVPAQTAPPKLADVIAWGPVVEAYRAHEAETSLRKWKHGSKVAERAGGKGGGGGGGGGDGHSAATSDGAEKEAIERAIAGRRRTRAQLLDARDRDGRQRSPSGNRERGDREPDSARNGSFSDSQIDLTASPSRHHN